MLLVNHLNANGNEIQNAKIQLLASDPGSPANGQIWVNSTDHVLKIRLNGITIGLGRLDQISSPTAAVSFNSQKITNLADPTNPQDAATRAWVLSALGGVTERIADPVVLALTSNVNTASPGANLDGRAMQAGDIVLLAGQTTTTENDFWMWNGASSAMTRQTTIPVIDGTLVSVELGTNAGKVYIQRATPSGGRGTWSQDWAQFGAGTTYGADGTTIALTGNTFSLVTPVTVANGGTGAATAAAARTNLGAIGKYAVDIGNGSATQITVNHQLGTTDVQVFVTNKLSPAQWIIPDIFIVDANNVRIDFTVAPTASQYRVVVQG